MWAATVARLTESADMEEEEEKEPRVPCDSDYERLSVLGIGSFGRVVLAKRRDTGDLFALKLIAYSKLTLPKHLERTQTERDVLSSMRHENIVKLYCAYRTSTHFALVSEYCPGGELFHHLCRRRVFKAAAVAFYAAELSLALDCAHARGIVYRDVKPENCLLDSRGHLKLVDFGLAKVGVADLYLGAHSVCGTLEYMAPDVLAKKPSGYGLSVDWWGLGIWTYELLTGLPPWYGPDRHKLFKNIRHAPLRIPPYVSLAAASLLANLLRRHPRERLVGLQNLKRHSFFANIDFDTVSTHDNPPIRPKQGLANNFDAKFAALDVDDDDPPPTRKPATRTAAIVVDRASLQNWDYARPLRS
ncbi:hypothetical protein CTAYLR_001487 [Chrysophaeum taylorii]|uniref:Protein kinase domain-containing protein n=1 Tax=Chrysophaeum taylorii TaxID=2483200 RepID=A0AAD7UD90_9STRA|nr:hypothetical protein CTAYLR_001487 [Chrysophaeum taylorii]